MLFVIFKKKVFHIHLVLLGNCILYVQREWPWNTSYTVCQLCSLTLGVETQWTKHFCAPSLLSKSFMCLHGNQSLPLRMQPISWFLTWANICCFSIGNQVFGNKSTSSIFFSFPYPFHFFFILTVHAMDGGVFGDKAAEGYQGWVLNARWYCILLCKNFCLNLAIALQTDYNNRMGKVYIPSFYYPLWSTRTLFKLLTYVASVFTSVTGQDFFHWRHFFVAKSAGFGLILYIYIEQ